MRTELFCIPPFLFYHPGTSRIVIQHALPEELSWLPLMIILMLVAQLILGVVTFLIYRKFENAVKLLRYTNETKDVLWPRNSP